MDVQVFKENEKIYQHMCSKCEYQFYVRYIGVSKWSMPKCTECGTSEHVRYTGIMHELKPIKD